MILQQKDWKAYRVIACCYKNLDNYAEARLYLDKAHKEAPHLRDPLVERAILEFEQKNYILTIYMERKIFFSKT